MHAAYKQTADGCMQYAAPAEPKSAGDMTGYGLLMQYESERGRERVHGQPRSIGE